MYVKFCRNYFNDDGGSKGKSGPADETAGLQRQLCVLRWLCVSLLLLCIVLGAVLTALLLRGLQSDCSSVDYRAPPRPQADCLTLREQPAIPPTIDCTGEQCTRCKQDWLFFEGVCFLLSYDRMSWEDSRQDCRERGGDLAVIPDLKTQEFLSRRGSLFYWIGLTRDSTGQWTWTNGTTVTKGYWAPPGAAGVSSGRCAALIGRSNPKLSWAPAPCSHLAFRVCQSAPRWAP